MARLQIAPTGHRIGSSHHRAYLDEQDCALIRELNSKHGIGYAALGKKFPRPDGSPTPKSTIRNICTYRTRYAS